MPLPLLKSLLAGLVLLLAVFQLLQMLQVRRYIHVFPWAPKTLLRLHRWGGVLTLALTALIVALCLYDVFGLGYPVREFPVIAHAVLGGTAGLLLLGKVAASNRFRKYLRYGGRMGVATVSLLALTFWFSAVQYLTR